MCDWLLYSMSKTQAHLTVDSSQGLFSLDFFIYAIVIATGCEVFCPPLRVANSMDWLDRLPLALDMLSKSPQWSGNIARVCDANPTSTMTRGLISFELFFSDFRISLPFEHTSNGFARPISKDSVPSADLYEKSRIFSAEINMDEIHRFAKMIFFIWIKLNNLIPKWSNSTL